MKVNGELDNGLVRYESKSEIMYSDRFAGFVGFAGQIFLNFRFLKRNCCLLLLEVFLIL